MAHLLLSIVFLFIGGFSFIQGISHVFGRGAFSGFGVAPSFVGRPAPQALTGHCGVATLSGTLHILADACIAHAGGARRCARAT